MSIEVVLPAAAYYGLIEKFTTPTDRLIHPHAPIEMLPDGRIRWQAPDMTAELLAGFALEGETPADTIERLWAIGNGHVS